MSVHQLTRRPGDVRHVPLVGRASSLGRRATPLAWAPRPRVLDEAVLWLDAADLASGDQTWRNRGWGTGLDATLGSTAGSDTNDPLILPWGGANYAYTPGGGTSNMLSVPDAADLDITGDLEVVALLAPDDWTPAATAAFVSRTTLVDPNRAWDLRVTTTGRLRLTWWPTGSSASGIGPTSTVAPAVTDGQWLWVKATLDVDNGSSGNEVRFFTAAFDGTFTEPSSWSQLGSTVTTAGATSLPNVASRLYFGWTDGGTAYTGKLGRVIVRNGIGGTTVLDINAATDITSGAATTFTATSGQTVTVHRATSGRKTVLVTRPCLLFGTDDYAEIADSDLLDFGAADSFTVAAVHQPWATQGTNDVLVAKKANTTNTTAGWSLTNGAATALAAAGQVGDGTNGATATGATRTAGALALSALVRDVGADTVTVAANGTLGTPTTDATTATSANAEAVRIGRLSGAGAEYADMECFAVAIWRRALTAGELYAVARYYGAVA